MGPWMSHLAHIYESVNESCHAYLWVDKCVISHISMGRWMSHVTHIHRSMSESRNTCLWVDKWVVSHISIGQWVSHVTHVYGSINESRHTYPKVNKWVTSHMSTGQWVSHITHVNGSINEYHPQIWLFIFLLSLHIDESCHAYLWVNGRVMSQKSRHETVEFTAITLSYVCVCLCACVCVCVRACVYTYQPPHGRVTSYISTW